MDENKTGENSTKGHRIGWTPLFNGIPDTECRETHGLYSRAQLQKLIEYEQRRSERTGGPNTMLVCHLNGSHGNERTTRRIVEVIRRSVRETDHLGWLSEAELAVLLPDTRPEAAEELKRKLEESGFRQAAELRIEAF